MSNDYQLFLDHVSKTPLIETNLKVGDKVKYINGQGIDIGDFTVVGFVPHEHQIDREEHIYLDMPCYYIPVSEKKLAIQTC